MADTTEGAVGESGGGTERGRLYWFGVNLRRRTGAFFGRHKLASTVLGLVAGTTTLGLRAAWHPLVIAVRRQIYVPLSLLLLLALAWACGRLKLRRLKFGLLAVAAVGLVAFAISAYLGADPYRYVAQYYRYRTLEVEEVGRLPTTDFERIQPQNSVFTLAKEAMTDSETPTRPDLVRVDGQYRWTMGIEPAYTLPRFADRVGEIFSVEATVPSPSFSRQNRLAVDFYTGEYLLLGKNAQANAVKTFGPWRFLNYEPADVKYVRDGRGQWVQLVSLIRWRGLIFPRPEFGGVHVVENGAGRGVLQDLGILATGTGTWIHPRAIADHPYLRGQNIVPYDVSRYNAESFKFQNGFLSPMPQYHRGDIRIPDLPRDVNDQPFTAYFRFSDRQGAEKLYHYFALEPYDPQKQGLNTSLFAPADGLGPVLVYKHFQRREALSGVSAIAAKVMESRKEYDWERSKPVEHRPFIKDVGGKRRFFWLTTVVTRKESGQDFIAGSVPDVVLTDAEYKVVSWVDALKPDSWIPQLERELGSVWQ